MSTFRTSALFESAYWRAYWNYQDNAGLGESALRVFAAMDGDVARVAVESALRAELSLIKNLKRERAELFQALMDTDFAPVAELTLTQGKTASRVSYVVIVHASFETMLSDFVQQFAEDCADRLFQSIGGGKKKREIRELLAQSADELVAGVVREWIGKRVNRTSMPELFRIVCECLELDPCRLADGDKLIWPALKHFDQVRHDAVHRDRRGLDDLDTETVGGMLSRTAFNLAAIAMSEFDEEVLKRGLSKDG